MRFPKIIIVVPFLSPVFLQLHELQHARLPCPSLFPRVYTNSISVTPFSCCPQSFQASGYFSNESAFCIMWPKYWTFSFSISPSNKYSGLISCSIDWFDLLKIQGTLKSLLQHHNLKASILWGHSAFFMGQLSHPYMTTGKTIALTCSRIQISLFFF